MTLRIDGGGAWSSQTPVLQNASLHDAPTQPAAAPKPAQLASGQKLQAGQSVRSADGRFELTMQRDGNLVEYDTATHVAVWSSKTAGSGASVAIMQKDGNLVLYKVDPSTLCVAGKNAVWSSNTSSHNGAYLAVQKDGNLVIYPAGQSKPDSSLWNAGLPQPEVPPALPSLPAAPASVDPLPNTAVGLFKPGQAELGIRQFPLKSGDTAYGVLQNNQVFAQPGLTDDTPLLDDNLSATPGLDRQPFGTRPANPPGAVTTLQPGQSVTVLDSTRLGYLQQERTQLQAAESAQPKDKSARLGDLTATLYQELDYAGTQQSVPDAAQLAVSIRQRAPNDPTLQSAVDDAVALYQKTLDAQGRTPAQLGALNAAAAAGDWKQVETLAAQQLVATAGNDQGAQALGDLTARGSVYLTYAGGDPHFAAAVEKGLADAQKTVLIDRPVQTVLDAYRKDGAAAAMTALKQITDPQVATPAQVGQIMADARIQRTVTQALHDVSDWQGNDGNSPSQVMLPLAAACQHAIESDQGTNGLGKQAVDRIATAIVGEADGVPPDSGMDLFQNVRLTQQIFSDAAGQGNVALGLSVAAQARLYQNPIYASAAIDGTRLGLDTLAGSVKSLDDKTGKDAAFLSVPLKDWGGDSTPAQQQALIKTLLADNPDDAKTLNDDGLQIQQMQETTDSVRMAIAAYGGALKGVTGFDTDAPNDGSVVGQYRWSVANSPSVTKAVAALPALAGAGQQAPDQPATNTLWFDRSLRKVVEQAGKKLVASLAAGGPDAVLSPKGAKIASAVWARANKSLGAVLYFQNAAYSLSQASEDGLLSGVLNSASGIRQDLAGVSYAMSATIPDGALSSIRPGSGATPLAQGYDSIAAKIAQLDVPDLARSGLKVSLHLAMQDTSDVASAILGASEAAQEFAHGETWQGVGNVLNAAGYTALLTGPGIDASELPVGATVLGLDAAGWTGIGAVLVLAGATIYTAANAHASSHEYDGNDARLLTAMGVKPAIADQLAKHATSLDGAPPTAGPFLAAYFKYAKASQTQMVQWLNSLSPHDADAMASAIKAAGDDWQKMPMAQAARSFDDALLQYGVMPPVSW